MSLINIIRVLSQQSSGTGQIYKDIWLPETSSNSYYNKESNWNFGLMVAYAMTTYSASDSYEVNKLNLPPNKSVFTPPADIETKAAGWVTSLESACNPDYYVLLTGHHIGFDNWPSSTELQTQSGISDAQHGTVTLPFNNNYHSDYDHVGSFVKAAKAVGKPVILYHNVGKDINARGSNYYGSDTLYKAYKIAKIKELINRYKPYGIWCDAMQWYPTGDDSVNDDSAYSELYTALKNHRNEIRLTYNSNNGVLGANSFYDSNSDLLSFPKDTASREANISNTSEWSGLANFEGADYYVNFEKVTTIGSSGVYLGDNISLRTLANVQSEYDQFTGYGARYLLSIAPNKSGDIPSNQLTLLSGLSL